MGRALWHIAFFLIFIGFGYLLAAAIAQHP